MGGDTDPRMASTSTSTSTSTACIVCMPLPPPAGRDAFLPARSCREAWKDTRLQGSARLSRLLVCLYRQFISSVRWGRGGARTGTPHAHPVWVWHDRRAMAYAVLCLGTIAVPQTALAQVTVMLLPCSLRWASGMPISAVRLHDVVRRARWRGTWCARWTPTAMASSRSRSAPVRSLNHKPHTALVLVLAPPHPTPPGPGPVERPRRPHAMRTTVVVHARCNGCGPLTKT